MRFLVILVALAAGAFFYWLAIYVSPAGAIGALAVVTFIMYGAAEEATKGIRKSLEMLSKRVFPEAWD